jgi:long-chain acyl-CoA synthetase
MTSVVDHNPEKMSTIGTICPHTSAKIIGPNGQILPRGSRGELCIAGYCVTNGYFRNPEKTKEALVKDAQGTIWLHTGDEAVLNERGYCRITGRIKDIIIRGTPFTVYLPCQTILQ